MKACRGTVLVVEDEPLIRMALADALVDDGYRVLEAGSVIEAIATPGFHDIDALITDVDMPGALNGLDLVRLVHSIRKSTPVIVTSGRCCIEGSFIPDQVLFIPKPYNFDDLLEALSSMISAHMPHSHAVPRGIAS